MCKLRAEDARKIANDNSEAIQSILDDVFKMIECTAKEGRFKLNYTSEISDVNLITPVMEQLTTMGYSVDSCSLKNVNLTIGW